MTNREWINSLSNEQLVKLMRTFKDDSCEFCAYNSAAECGYCFDGQTAWLEQEHDDESFDERDYRYCV
jgi:hypothetical protein